MTSSIAGLAALLIQSSAFAGISPPTHKSTPVARCQDQKQRMDAGQSITIVRDGSSFQIYEYRQTIVGLSAPKISNTKRSIETLTNGNLLVHFKSDLVSLNIETVLMTNEKNVTAEFIIESIQGKIVQTMNCDTAILMTK